MKRILVVGDAHVDEHQPLDRFAALGNKIAAERPDVVLFIGDFLSLNCLSAWDKNKRAKMEGKRYHLEIEAGNKALDLMASPISALNSSLKKSKKAPYTPEMVFVMGNHEDRLARYLDTDPTFLGTVSVERDLHLKERGFTIVEYKEVYYVDGVGFTHCPISGMGRAISNPTVTQKALKLFAHSIVFGHTHTLDHSAEHRHGAPHLNQALCVGCFFEHVDDYAIGSKTDYWRGVVDLTLYSTNRFDFATTSMARLYQQYGDKK